MAHRRDGSGTQLAARGSQGRLRPPFVPQGDTSMPAAHQPVPFRVDWVDVAKGMCIIMVVMMHSTLGVEKAAGARAGWAPGGVRRALPHAGLLPDRRPVPRPPHRRAVAALSRPQGPALRLFLRALADDPVRLQGAGHGRRARLRPARAACISRPSCEPFGTLWFIYHLALFFVAAKLLRPAYPVIVLVGAAVLEIAPGPHRLGDDRRVLLAASSGSTPVTRWRRASSPLAEDVMRRPTMALVAVLVWAASNAAIVVFGGSPSCPSSASSSALPAPPR